jgi:methyl-accepting chemotaxis protein
VEQASAAANSMQNQAAALAQLVSVFSLDHAGKRMSGVSSVIPQVLPNAI